MRGNNYRIVDLDMPDYADQMLRLIKQFQDVAQDALRATEKSIEFAGCNTPRRRILGAAYRSLGRAAMNAMRWDINMFDFAFPLPGNKQDPIESLRIDVIYLVKNFGEQSVIGCWYSSHKDVFDGLKATRSMLTAW